MRDEPGAAARRERWTRCGAPYGSRRARTVSSHWSGRSARSVARAQLQVSFDNGTSWRPAALARICHGQVCTNSYRATYTAPAGAQVSLRVTARDTNGATVTETILAAYQTA